MSTDNTRSRRDVLALGSGALAGGIVLTAGLATRVEAATASCGGLTKAQYMEYVTLFNNNDPAFLRYYHDDVVLELGTQQIRTPAGIRAFYAGVKAHIKEKVEVTHFVSDATGIAAELPTEFRVFKDWGKDNFFQRELKAGEVMRTISLGLYVVKDGKFTSIKAARYRQVHDWRMESV